MFIFTLGTKLEHNDYTGFELEPSGRLQWNAGGPPIQMVLGRGFARGADALARSDRDFCGSPPAFCSSRRVPPGFSKHFEWQCRISESETLIAYELGYRAQLGPKVVRLRLRLFTMTTDDVRSTEHSTPVTPFPNFGLPLLLFQNNLEGKTYGIELSGDYQVVDWWRLHAGYDLLKENIHVKAGRDSTPTMR